ncbi:MAG: phage terminase Nu1 subunit (DNA packaging protein) [Brevundimonas sp.]|jgi:phage terminase Nu1 subunit (DNA packaging protein)|uniref:hypothetical protein n=1 Tax=Brevundimonas sp. TaxID=1871086 RepID=UPI0039E629E5
MSSDSDLDILELIGPPPSPAAMPPEAQEAVTEAHLADLLGLTSRRVRDLVSDGVIPKAAPGRFDARLATRAYCEWLRDKASKGRGSQDPAYREERTRLAKQQADKAELANAAQRRELLPAAEVLNAWSLILRNVRAEIMAVPSRVQAKLPGLSRTDVAEIDREIRDALILLSEGTDASGN